MSFAWVIHLGVQVQPHDVHLVVYTELRHIVSHSSGKVYLDPRMPNGLNMGRVWLWLCVCPCVARSMEALLVVRISCDHGGDGGGDQGVAR
jgi:hypothetical protein